MKGLKQILLLFFVFLASLFIVSCSKSMYSLTLPDGVSASVENLDKIEKNTEIILTITPPVGKELESLKVNNSVVSVSNNTYSFKITENTVVEVAFKDIQKEEVKFKLTLPAGVKSNQTNLDEILENTAVTLTVTVPVDKEVAYFKVNGVNVNLTDNKYTFRIIRDTVVEVGFQDLKPGVKYYSITLPSGVVANVTNTSSIEENTEVTLTITVPAGKELEYLKVNNVEVSTTNNEYTFIITKDTTVTISFKDIPVGPKYYKLTLPASVHTELDDLDNILENTEIILTVVIPLGDELEYLKVNGNKVLLVGNTYTFNITKNTVVEALFVSGWHEMTNADALNYLKNINTTLFREGVFKFVVNGVAEEELVDYLVMLEFDSDLNVLSGIGQLINQDSQNITFYTDGTYIHHILEVYEDDPFPIHEEGVIVLSLKAQLIEVALGFLFSQFFEGAHYIPSGPLSLNDALDVVLGYALGE